jgi:hypothetical protein
MQGNCTDDEGNFYECGEIDDSDLLLDAATNPICATNGPSELDNNSATKVELPEPDLWYEGCMDALVEVVEAEELDRLLEEEASLQQLYTLYT